MQTTARDAYLAAQVMTAPPQKLRLMLIDGAIRFIRMAQQHRAAAEDQDACQALIRAQEIVGEILAGFKRELNSDLVHRVAAVYAFVLRNLVEGNMLHDDGKLADALRVLDIERETWRQLCEQVGAGQPGPIAGSPPASPAAPIARADGLFAAESAGGFCLEA